MEREKWIPLQAPIYMNWNYTYRCPFNCRHCYSRGRENRELSLADQFKVADNIIRNGVFYVNFGGGEPFTSSNLPAVIRRLHEGGVYVNVSTNGYLLSREKMDAVIRSGLNGIVVSVDSANAAVHDDMRNHTGSFEAMKKSVAYFAEQGIRVFFSTVVTRRNLYDIEAVLELADSMSCYEIELKRMKLVGNALNEPDLVLTPEDEDYLVAHIPEWRKNYRVGIQLIYKPEGIEGIDLGCPCGKAMMTILDNGDMSACAYSPIIIGNALTDEIGKVWQQHPVLKGMRNSYSCPGLQT